MGTAVGGRTQTNHMGRELDGAVEAIGRAVMQGNANGHEPPSKKAKSHRAYSA